MSTPTDNLSLKERKLSKIIMPRHLRNKSSKTWQIVRNGSGRVVHSVSGALAWSTNSLPAKLVPPSIGQSQHLIPITLLEQATFPWKRLQDTKIRKKFKIFF